MKIAILNTQVPFVRGGAEILADGLLDKLRLHGHQAEIVRMPFKWYPSRTLQDHIFATRLLDLTESCGDAIDLVIPLKFPMYHVRHPRKVAWMLHQHRQAYDLWDSPWCDLRSWPDGAAVRRTIIDTDNACLDECRAIYTLSQTVSDRLLRYNQRASIPVYHPPQGEGDFSCKDYGDFFYFPSRLNGSKRQALVLQALAKCAADVRIIFSGPADSDGERDEFIRLAKELDVTDRMEYLGPISRELMVELYATCRAVIFPPLDEDYGYITLEGMLSSKAVVTCHDSGGPLEFIRDGIEGLVSKPTADDLAACLNRLVADRPLCEQLGIQSRQRYVDLNISWESLVSMVTA